MREKILNILRNTDEYVSGQQLCEELHVSRTAVWKNINRLKEEGYEIEALKNKGYHLVETPDILSEAEIGSLCATKWAAKKMYYFDKIDSTNVYAARIAGEGAPHGTLVTADAQSSGKGRRGRAWESPKGIGVWMSLLLKPTIHLENASKVTLVMALAVTSAIKNCYQLDAKIKWPNDIVIDGKKICGILTEMSIQRDYINYIVIGCGINVNNTSFPEEIRDRASSIRMQLGADAPVQKRSYLIAECMKQFEHYYEKFEETEDLSGLLEEYNSLLVNLDQKIRVLQPNHEYDGIGRGINKEGELIVERADGSMENVYAGEVSVRGIYGYV